MSREKKIKILYVFFKDYPWDIRVDKITRSLKDEGYDVSIAARSVENKNYSDDANGIKIFRAGAGKRSSLTLPFNFNPLWKKDLTKIAGEVEPDLIIVREIIIAKTAAEVARQRKIPVIMDMAENYPAAMREWKKYNRSFLKRFLVHKAEVPDKIENIAVGLMDGIITVCEEQNKRLKDEYNYPIKKISVVHNTPRENTFKQAAEGIVNKDLVLCHHGYLTAEKSIMNFLKGFSEFKRRTENNIKLVIAGDGENFKDYKLLIDKFGLHGFVKMTGSYSQEELPDIISKIDIGIIPYPLNDFNNYTIHNKIFDYFAAGKPVITSEAKPLRRIIGETGAGVAIDCEDPENITDFLLKMENYDWEKLAKNAKNAYNKQYNWEKDRKELLKFIKNVLNA